MGVVEIARDGVLTWKSTVLRKYVTGPKKKNIKAQNEWTQLPRIDLFILFLIF